MTTNPANKNDNALVLLFVAACVCASLFCCISSLSTSAFLLSGEKNDDTPSPTHTVPVGTPIQCTANDLRGSSGSVYRSMEDGTFSHYPNPEIASSWDSDWSENVIGVDCAGFTKGEPLKMK